MKKAFLFMLLLSSIILFGCSKKTTTKEDDEIKYATVAMIYINYSANMDNKENLDVIDEGCSYASVEKDFYVCEPNVEKTFTVSVVDGYYIKRYTVVQEYSIKNAKFYELNGETSVTIKPKPSINYLVFDIVKIEE